MLIDSPKVKIAIEILKAIKKSCKEQIAFK